MRDLTVSTSVINSSVRERTIKAVGNFACTQENPHLTVVEFCTLAPVKISIGTVIWPSSFLPQQTKASDSTIAQVCCPPAETACHHTLSEDQQMWSISRHWDRSYLNSK